MPHPNWILRPPEPAASAALAAQLGVSPLVAQLLLRRGLGDPARATVFLDPRLQSLHDPETLPGVPEAADRLIDAAAKGRRVVVYGDYDVDGISGAAILLGALELAGATPTAFIPDRLGQGYGVHAAALDRLREEGAELVVTVDCGITACSEAEHARQLGLELIITDHHTPPPTLPRADGVVHPACPGSPYPFAGLSGSGVAFKLAWAMGQRMQGARRVSPAFRQFLLEAVNLATLGAVADVVPLMDENRILVVHGLKSLGASTLPGIQALLHLMEKEEGDAIRAEDIAFGIAPRLNAMSRLGHAVLALELMRSRSADRARELANFSDQINRQRQTAERAIVAQAEERVESEGMLEAGGVILLADERWHVGLVGIAAGRLAERFRRPVILLAIHDGVAHGSGRSIAGVNLHQIVSPCMRPTERFGGHQAAIGMTIATDRVEELRRDLAAAAPTAQAWEGSDAGLTLDAEVLLSSLSRDAVREIERLGPFGEANRRPQLLAANVAITGVQTVGQGGYHLRFMAQQGGRPLKAIAFRQGNRAPDLAEDQRYDIAFSPVLNTYRGFTSVDLHVSDFRPAVA